MGADRNASAGGRAGKAALRSGWALLLAAARRDCGAASLLVLAIGLVFGVTGSVGATTVLIRGARAEARDAADLGGLAGAQRALEGSASACDRAAEVVAANRARLTACRLDGLLLEIEVETDVPGLDIHVVATARAGPGVRDGS
jgi:secretion/DNA translocation related TadE-like protein